MNSENQQKITAYLVKHQTATARQLAGVLGRNNRSTWNILMHLLRRGIITHCDGEGRQPLKLTPDWESKVCHRKTTPRRKRVAPAVTQVCRQNWQGYKVHQIFGSARHEQ